jgi:DNA-binding LytR/AlgR family response regulator
MNKLKNITLLLLEEDLTESALLKALLKEIGVGNILIVTDYVDAMRMIAQYNPDIALLSIGTNNYEPGIRIATNITARNPIPLIFISSDYTMELYEKVKYLRPYAFMSKDLSTVQLKQAIELALEKPLNGADNLNGEHFEEEFSFEDGFIFVQVGNHYKKFKLSNIWWIESEGKYAALKSNKNRVLIDVPIRDLAEKLDRKGFIRTHKSFIINLKYVDYIDKTEAVVLVKGEKIPIGRSFKSGFFSRIKFS